MAQEELSEFALKVMGLIKKIPKGKVATYGQIAFMAGKPCHARMVGAILRKYTKEQRLPWQRVLGNQGRISLTGADGKKQARLLKAEGALFKSPGVVDMSKSQWKTGPAKIYVRIALIFG